METGNGKQRRRAVHRFHPQALELELKSGGPHEQRRAGLQAGMHHSLFFGPFPPFFFSLLGWDLFWRPG